jgi:hypothetical protein
MVFEALISFDRVHGKRPSCNTRFDLVQASQDLNDGRFQLAMQEGRLRTRSTINPRDGWGYLRCATEKQCGLINERTNGVADQDGGEELTREAVECVCK